MRLEDEHIVATLRGAFAPFNCVVELHDYHAKIGFRVYGHNDENLGTFEDQSVSKFRDPKKLATYITEVRAILARKNIQLNSWSFPTVF